MSSTHRQSEAGTSQVVVGKEARVAGVTYVEIGGTASLTAHLETIPTEDLDRLALENERLFKRRFGIDVPTPARASVIAIKQTHGFVDSEVRWLLRSGLLRVSRGSARLESSGWVLALGVLLALPLTAFCVSSLAVVMTSGTPAWQQGLASAALAGLCISANWIVARLFLIPWRLASSIQA